MLAFYVSQRDTQSLLSLHSFSLLAGNPRHVDMIRTALVRDSPSSANPKMGVGSQLMQRHCETIPIVVMSAVIDMM